MGAGKRCKRYIVQGRRRRSSSTLVMVVVEEVVEMKNYFSARRSCLPVNEDVQRVLLMRTVLKVEKL